MITAMAVCGYAALIGLAAPRALTRLWPGDRAPRRTIALLLSLAYSLPLAAVIPGLALGFTLLRASLAGPGPAPDHCADRTPPPAPAGGIRLLPPPVLGTFGIVVACLVVARIGYCLLATCLTARSSSRAHAAVLQLCGRVDAALGPDVTVIDHEQAASYCLPGRGGRIVVTSRAMQLLDTVQLNAVLTHERAHQRGRHHILLGLVAALRRSAPRVRMFRYSELEIRRLVELIADDAAARSHGRRTVAGALAVLGAGHAPGAALGVMEGTWALTRITRMANPAAGLNRRHTALTVAAVATAILLPLLLTTASVSILVQNCPPAAVRGTQRPTQAVTRLDDEL